MKQRKVGSKLLIKDEPAATIIQEGLEGYASGVFNSHSEVAKFFNAQSDFPSVKKGFVVRVQLVEKILRNAIYAGYVEYPPWQVALTVGQHEGLISLSTFKRIQDKLDGSRKMAARAGVAEDFPLRGFVVCSACNVRLTSCWAKGKMGKLYAYYHCKNRDCENYGKSIRRADLESAVMEILRSLEPEEAAFGIVERCYKTHGECKTST